MKHLLHDRFVLGIALLAVLASSLIGAWRKADRSFVNMWLTPDQQGQRFLTKQDDAEAAKRFRDPFRKAEAEYRAGQFQEAAASFGRVDSADAKFNRGNALVMLGKYDDAIASYDAALHDRPDWAESIENRQLAQARLAKLHPPNTGEEGTEGQEKPDELVFDNKPKQTGGEHDVEVVTGGEMSDSDIQALWLRNVQTKPADFLRAKFAYQFAREQVEEPSP